MRIITAMMAMMRMSRVATTPAIRGIELPSVIGGGGGIDIIIMDRWRVG